MPLYNIALGIICFYACGSFLYKRQLLLSLGSAFLCISLFLPDWWSLVAYSGGVMCHTVRQGLRGWSPYRLVGVMHQALFLTTVYYDYDPSRGAFYAWCIALIGTLFANEQNNIKWTESCLLEVALILYSALLCMKTLVLELPDSMFFVSTLFVALCIVARALSLAHVILIVIGVIAQDSCVVIMAGISLWLYNAFDCMISKERMSIPFVALLLFAMIAVLQCDGFVLLRLMMMMLLACVCTFERHHNQRMRWDVGVLVCLCGLILVGKVQWLNCVTLQHFS
ncbi:MAG: hypothetical protein OXC30_01740 [Alphaproteobacteria bacterium]|nr:hypothetical protein [Alphaproteobacteria bacterium]